MGEFSVVRLIIRMLVSLVVVLAIVGVASGLFRKGRRGFGPLARRGPIEILARQPLGRNASIAVARVGSRTLILGVTESAIALLVDGGPELSTDIMGPPRTAEPGEADMHASGRVTANLLLGTPRTGNVKPSWSEFVETVRQRTTRRS